jgi:hypothetical protein
MDASLVSNKDLAHAFQAVHTTYRLHVSKVIDILVSPMPSSGPTTTDFGQQLEIVLKRSKLDGCVGKPTYLQLMNETI